ncbi:MAG: T9SS type A sorting domain-containing protein [Bacteroidales bacterium]|nr:T9SS type A sorting domain-containing protein [Bacteroidales bacterium]
MRKVIFITSMVVFSLGIKAQDTLTVMTYNLLNFNNNTSYCTQSNNNVNDKISYLKTITSYVLPDIVGFNEIHASNATIQLILDSILNTNGIKTYSRIQYINSSNSDIVSSIFYNNKKLKLYSTNYLQTDLRDVIILNLYYNSQEMQNNHDTVFIRVMQAHLKAGSTTSDQDQRAQETSVIMNYLNSLGNSKNTILMGDFNVQSSTETAFQNLINYSNMNVRFYDPVNKLGNWNNNSSFALYHTQAVQLNSNGCTSGGGLDDRFDFILASFSIMNNLYKVKYVANSYKVIGQDGNHFNQSVDNPANYSVPSNVLTALANMSDHLPVTLKLAVQQTPFIGIEEANLNNFNIKPYSWIDNELILSLQGEYNGNLEIHIYDLMGRKVFTTYRKLFNDELLISVQTPSLDKGLYIVQYQLKGLNKSLKVIHK